MSQIDADQKNTTAVIDELAAAMGRPLTDIEKLSVTTAMYQRQRDDLLAIAEKLDALQRQFEFYSMGNKMPGNDLYSGLLMEIVNEARAAIAAARGENGAIVPTPHKESTSLAAKEIEMIVAADTETDHLWD